MNPDGKQDIEKKPQETITHAGEALGYWIAAAWPIRKPEPRAGVARLEHLL